MAGFNAISLKLKEMYQMITLGGDAELELVDSLDPFSEVRTTITARHWLPVYLTVLHYASALGAPAYLYRMCHYSHSAAGHRVQCASSQEELEGHC